MSPKTQTGYLVLADISGFTAYLAGVELEHAHEILSDLMETILKRFKPLLTVSKLEGDAVFAYAPNTHVPRAETVLEVLEATYVAFRDKQDNMHRRTTCDCNACRAIPSLDLKFMTHHGQYIFQRVGDHEELIGSDVNLAHRLMKNHVAEATGWRAYALFSEAAFRQLGVAITDLHEQTETYEHLGDIRTYSFNLHPRYAALTATRQVVVRPEDAHGRLHLELAAPPLVVWDWINAPEKKLLWEKLDTIVIARPQGRTQAGARNHCAHGKTVEMIETILDWKPFDYFTIERQANGVSIKFIITYYLKSIADARTQLTVCAQMQAPLPAFLLPNACRLFIKLRGIDKLHINLMNLIAQDQASPPRLEAQPF